MRHIIVVISDTHGGHRLGLLQPDTVLYRETKDGGLVQRAVDLTECQNALYNWQEGCLNWVRRFSGCDPVTLLHLGDMAHGNGHATELVSTRMADQITIARDNLLRWKNGTGAARVILCTGTDVHEFMEGSAAILVQQMSGDGVQLVNHGMLSFEGYKVDAAHHGAGAGARAWLRGNVARYYAQSLVISDVLAGQKPPDLILRGHVHDPIDEIIRTNGHRSRMVICPPFCFPGAYALKVTRSVSRVAFGAMVFEVVNGRLASEPTELIERIDLRQEITI